MAKKNILFILCDQLSADVLQPYGGKIPTPNLCRLAQNGVTFSSCYCQTPVCTPSRSTMITGLYPHENGVVSNVMRLDYPTVGGPETEEGICNRDRTTEQTLCDHDWNTMHIGKWHLSGEQLRCYPRMFREHQEFDLVMKDRYAQVAACPREEYMDWYGWKLPVDVKEEFAQAADRIGDKWKNVPNLNDFYAKMGHLALPEEETYDYQVASRCVQAIRQADPDRPFMITCSFNAPHDPNVISSPYYEQADPEALMDRADWPCEERYQKELSGELPRQGGPGFLREFLRVYDGCVRMIDKHVGEILDELEKSGRMDDTLILFTADHGDMTGAHNMFWKSTSSFYEQVARVPLIVSGPGVVRGGHCDTPVELRDLPNTLLEFCGVEHLPDSSGISLLPALAGEALEHPPVLSERLNWPEGHVRCRHSGDKNASFMLRDGVYKYVVHIDDNRASRLLYNLEQDPTESRNLADSPEMAQQCSRMHTLLAQRLEQTGYHLQDLKFH